MHRAVGRPTSTRSPVEDAASVADFWQLQIADPTDPAAAADLNDDGKIDIADLEIVLENLGSCAWPRR